MDQGVLEIGIAREQSRGSRPSSGVVVGVVVRFDGAFAVFSMMFRPLAANFGTHFRKVSLNSTSQGGACA